MKGCYIAKPRINNTIPVRIAIPAVSGKSPATGVTGVTGVGVAWAMSQLQSVWVAHDGFRQKPPTHCILDGHWVFEVHGLLHASTWVGVGVRVLVGSTEQLSAAQFALSLTHAFKTHTPSLQVYPDSVCPLEQFSPHCGFGVTVGVGVCVGVLVGGGVPVGVAVGVGDAVGVGVGLVNIVIESGTTHD